MSINKKSNRFGKSVFIGNINHKTSVLAFLQIKGEKRRLKKTYKNNINILPSKMFKEKILNIDVQVYVSGNRNDCGTNKVHQNNKRSQKPKNRKYLERSNEIIRRTEKQI